MRLEIISAADFLVQLLRLQSGGLTEGQLQSFKGSLTEVLRRRYHDHWFPDRPNRGSGYRCIRINGKMDPVIAQAGMKVGLVPTVLHSLFPSELTMWIDPREVSYRIGENGSICVLFEGSDHQQEELEVPATNNETNKQLQANSSQAFLQPQQRQQQAHHLPRLHQHQSLHHIHTHSIQRNNHHSNHNNLSMAVHNHQQQPQFESCKDSLLLEHTQFNEQIAAFVSS